jgi:large subunit ribosomal protein L25
METYHLKAKIRTVTGKKVKLIRQDQELPVVLYGNGIEPKLLTVSRGDFNDLYNEAGGSSLVQVEVEGEKEPLNVLFHQVDFHPLTDEIVHADFLQVKLNEKITTSITLVLAGEEDAPVVKEKEGTIVLNKDSIEVEAFPQDLVQEITIDVSALAEFDQTIHVKDVVLPDKIAVLDDPEEVVVTIQEPRSEEELAELDEAVEEDVEAVEVEKKGIEDEDEAGTE